MIEDLNNIKELYIVIFIVYNKKYYTLWYTSEKESFIIDEDNLHIKSFSNIGSVKIFAQQNNAILNDEITEILCDKTILFDWYNINYNNILTFWNIISDIAITLNRKFLGDCNNEIITRSYNKLFYGCNLPAIKGKNDDFIPKWTKNEKEILLKVINDGLNILIDGLNIQ